MIEQFRYWQGLVFLVVYNPKMCTLIFQGGKMIIVSSLCDGTSIAWFGWIAFLHKAKQLKEILLLTDFKLGVAIYTGLTTIYIEIMLNLSYFHQKYSLYMSQPHNFMCANTEGNTHEINKTCLLSQKRLY